MKPRTALTICALALTSCAPSTYQAPPTPDPTAQTPGSVISAGDWQTYTFCDHGNRVYREGDRALAVVPADPTCQQPAPR